MTTPYEPSPSGTGSGPAVADDDPTTRLPRTGGPGDRGESGARRPLLVAAAVLGLLAVLYLADLLFSATAVPRGVTVAGVGIGGMAKPEAQALLARELTDRTTRPVALRAGDAAATLDPAAVGLGVDVDATVARAGEQPLKPWTRLSSLFSTRDVAPVSTGTPATVGVALQGLRPQLDRAPTGGTISFAGAEPVGVPPRPGQTLDAAEGAEAVLAHWLDPAPVVLPVAVAPVAVTPEGVEAALRDVARPAVAAPLYVVGDGATATLTPQQIGQVLRFSPDGQGGLAAAVDPAAARRLLEPQLDDTETAMKDATYQLAGESASIVPAVTGRGIQWDRTLAGALPALLRPAAASRPPTFTSPPTVDGATPAEPPAPTGRTVNAAYTTTPPTLTTAALQAAGPPTVIGEFETGGFAADSGRNIRRVAEQVQGATVAPGSTFSLNGYTGPRDATQGYVDAGIIDDGVPSRGVGGGISQFATTLYNASYFAGLVDVEHKEHSYYISRYPAGREATVFEGAIDLRFRNDGPTPVLIRTTWTPSSIKVQIYGQKRFDVTSTPGPRTAPTPAGTRDLSARPECKPSAGVAGFTITDTRTLRDLATGAVRTEPRTVRYDPEPEITCGGGP